MTLRGDITGAWELVSFTVSDGSRPLGGQPRGLILYTEDGHMSAQLTGGDQHIAYGGRFSVDETSATVHHQVSISTMPELLAQPQFRHAAIVGDELTLSTADAVLVWRRPAAQDCR
jgi:hypothetical protein